MSQPEMRMASDAEIDATDTMASPFIDALQTMSPIQAMHLWTYITARLILDLTPQPGMTRVAGFDLWAKSVRITIERNEAMHQAKAH